MSRIILEGPDGQGKTTLGLKLADRFRLGFYRRRCSHDVVAETARGLFLDHCVLDRSWLTDVHYSRVLDRTPACGRADVYRFGMIAARRCALMLKCLSERCAIPDTELVGERVVQHRLGQAYEEAHWSEHDRTVKLYGFATEQDLARIDAEYHAYAARLDAFTGHGIGNFENVELMVQWKMTLCDPVMFDLLFECGLMPHQVYAFDSDWEIDSAEIMESLKPKCVVKWAAFKRSVNGKTFDAAKRWLRERLEEAEVNVAPAAIETGWRRLDDDRDKSI